MANSSRMRRPSWAFWTLGAAVLSSALAILTFAIQVWVVAAVAVGLCAAALSTYRRLARRHEDRARVVVGEVVADHLDGLEVLAVPRGQELRGQAGTVPVVIFVGRGSEAGLLPYFTLTAERGGSSADGSLNEAEHGVMLAWLRRLPALEVDGPRVRMQFASWPEERGQAEVLLRCLVTVVQELEAASAPA